MQEIATVKKNLAKQGFLCSRIISLIEDRYPDVRKKLEEGEEAPGLFPRPPDSPKGGEDWLSPRHFREEYGKKAKTWLAREIFLHLAAVHFKAKPKARRGEGTIMPTIEAVQQILLTHNIHVSINRGAVQLSEMPVYERIKRSYPKPRSENMWADIEKHRDDSCQ